MVNANLLNSPNTTQSIVQLILPLYSNSKTTTYRRKSIMNVDKFVETNTSFEGIEETNRRWNREAFRWSCAFCSRHQRYNPFKIIPRLQRGGGGGNDNEVNSTDWSNSGHQSVDNSWIICRATKPPCKFAFTYKRMSQRRDRRACPSYSTVFVSSNQHDLPTNASNPSVLSPRCIAHEGIFF